MAKLTKSEEIEVIKNLHTFPYRGAISQIAREQGTSRQTIYHQVTKLFNPFLLAEVKAYGDKKIENFKRNKERFQAKQFKAQAI